MEKRGPPGKAARSYRIILVGASLEELMVYLVIKNFFFPKFNSFLRGCAAQLQFKNRLAGSFKLSRHTL